MIGCWMAQAAAADRMATFLMGRVADESMGVALQAATDHPVAKILNPARKVVFSRALKVADWAKHHHSRR
jgi:hypothetical protein